MWRTISAVATVLICGAGTARGGNADRAFDALLACRPAFFEVVKATRAAFGPLARAKPAEPAPGEQAAVTATFATPVEAAGVHLVGYEARILTQGGKPESYWWSFRTVESPAKVVEAIRSRAKDADFEQKGTDYGWVQELEPNWHSVDGSAVEHRFPQRMILIQPSSAAAAGSVVWCGVYKKKMGSLTGLPPISELFEPAR